MRRSSRSKPLLWLATLALGLAQAARPQSPSAPAKAPRLNLLLIVAEGLGTRLGSYGHAVKTPNIDRLAGLGRRFDSAYVQYPLGGPVRVSLMTGWRPETTGAFRDKASLREHARTLAPLQELLHDQGYYTARVGEVYGGQPEREMTWDLVAEPTTAAGGAEWAAERAVQVLAEKAGGPLFLAAGLGRPPNWKLPEQYTALYPPAEVRLPPEIAQPPGPLPAIGGDLGDPREARRVVTEAHARLGGEGLDVLVVSHGVWPPDDVPLAEMADAQWEATRRTNLDGVIYVCRAAIPLLRAGGTIVLVGSTAGQRGEPCHADYAATKGALHALTKSLAVELAPRITVNCVAPGWVDTEMAAKPFATHRAAIERTIPLGRVATADDIAGPIVFLCSPLARHITGEILNVNGGSVLCG
ncbi:MAG: SDR family oxidoreductase [Gemmatimonadales bacterium]